MSTLFDKNLLPEFDSVKDDDEQILWIDKPKFIPYLFNEFRSWLFSLAFGLIWIVFALKGSNDGGKDINSFYWLFGAIPLIQGAYVFLKRLLSFPNTVYAYSNKRIMIRTGFIGTDFKTIDYDKISDIEVNVNVIERLYNVGTVKFFSGRTQTDDGDITKIYDNWYAIANPYKIFKMVKQISVDIKTDYNYPNALRPDTNPGYQTKYDRK